MSTIITRHVAPILGILFLLLGGLTVPAWAQASPVNSSQYVTTEFSVPGGDPATVLVREGTFGVYGNDDLGLRIAIVPHVRDAVLGIVDFEVYEALVEFFPEPVVTLGEYITTGEGVVGGEVVVVVNGLPVAMEVAEVIPEPSFSTRFRTKYDRKQNPTHRRYSVEACCVICNGQLVCGGAVATGCGSCD